MVLWFRAGFTGGMVVWPWLPPRTGAEGSKGTVWAWAEPASNRLVNKKTDFIEVG